MPSLVIGKTGAFIGQALVGGRFEFAVQAIINGLDSAQSEGSGWDAVVKAGLTASAVVRTSDTVVTITLPAFGSYNITAQETITDTVPIGATFDIAALTATPTFTIDFVGGGGASIVPILMYQYRQRR